jgi:peptidylprolyl isomerase
MRDPRMALWLCLIVATAAGCSSGRKTNETAPASSTPSIPAPPDVAAPPADATRTPTGLASKVLKAGTGTRHPRANSQVVVHYTGWTTDGKMFDSSVARGEPAAFSLDGVIAGWTQGLQMMVVGEKRRFWIPPPLAYEGKDGPQGMLVFDIELIKIQS